MDDDKITALAREYAEEIRPYNDKTAPLSILDIREGERLIRFLLRRYCLVEKKDVEAKYQEAKERYFNPDDETEKTMYGRRMSMLESLFPEIKKEVEG